MKKEKRPINYESNGKRKKNSSFRKQIDFCHCEYRSE